MENPTVNSEQLQNIFDASAKTEGQIINLQVAVMKFSNPEIKRAATALKSQANELTALIAGEIEKIEGVNLGIGSQEEPTGPSILDAAPSPDNMIESEHPNMTDMLESAKRGMYIMHKLQLSESVIKSLSGEEMERLIEAFNPADLDNKNKEAKETAGDKEKAPLHEDDDMDMDTSDTSMDESLEPKVPSIDITKSFDKIKEGLSLKQMGEFKQSILEAISDKKFGKKFETVVSKIKDSKTVQEMKESIDTLYDYADQNNIKIKSSK